MGDVEIPMVLEEASKMDEGSRIAAGGVDCSEEDSMAGMDFSSILHHLSLYATPPTHWELGGGHPMFLGNAAAKWRTERSTKDYGKLLASALYGSEWHRGAMWLRTMKSFRGIRTHEPGRQV